jgi:hypothetical protein
MCLPADGQVITAFLHPEHHGNDVSRAAMEKFAHHGFTLRNRSTGNRTVRFSNNRVAAFHCQMRHIPSLVYSGVWNVAIRRKTQQKAAVADKPSSPSQDLRKTLKLQDGNPYVT